MKGPAASVALVLTLALVGCSSAPVGSAPESARASADASLAPTPPATPPTCNPLEDGGPCLGPLSLGTYSTKVFTPSMTYTVTDGWGNWEDLPGNVLLVPPGADLAGVNGGVSDFIGIYRGVAAAAADCQEAPAPGVGSSAQALADWLSNNPGLDASEPIPVAIGGLSGFVLDVTLAKDWTGSCSFAQARERLVPLIVGTGPAHLHQILDASFAARLYLLDLTDGNIVIEVVDHPEDGLSLDDYAIIVGSIRFGTQP